MPDIFDTRNDAQTEDDDDFDEDEDESGEEGYGGDDPVISREEERAINDERSAGGKAPVTPKRQLLAVFDAQGQVQVMYAVNGRPIEQPRQPTAEEYQAVKQRGYIVKGGLAEAVAGGIPWKPILIGVAVVGAAAGAYFYVNGKEEEAEANTVYVNGDEDEDEDDDADDADDDESED
jgi:hypothetical protein